MASWSVLVTIHNLVNIPLAACENGPRTFAVEAHMLHRASAYSAPVAAAIFTTDDVVSTTPNLFEVRLDEIAENTAGNGGGPKVWRCALPEMEAVVMVKEIVGAFRGSYRPRAREDNVTATADGTRIVGSSAPITLNVRDAVELEKLTTRVVGTEMGQVGLSFTVDPGDKEGYRHRLENFLRVHNPQGLRLVPSVVEAVSELDTFTKLYRRYKIRDYEGRLTAFFDVYGGQFKKEIPSLLRQWEGREEELMRNLILDNGPELSTVAPHQRLTAYLAAHQLDRKDAEVQAILAVHADAPDTTGLFASLVDRYGPEPDPRTYLFTVPRYTPPATLSAVVNGAPMSGSLSVQYARSPHEPHAPSTPPSSSSKSTHGVRDAVPRRSPPSPAPDRRQMLSVPMSPTPKAAGEVPVKTARSLSESLSFTAAAEDSRAAAAAPQQQSNRYAAHASAITPKDQLVLSDRAAGRGGRSGESRRGASLWHKMCSMMKTRRSESAPWREHQLFFMNPNEFTAAVRALHVFSDSGAGGDEVQDLVDEWERRVSSALREEPLSQSDAYYGAVAQEAADLTHLLPLQIQVISITSLFHKEHYSGFSTYVEEEAKARRTERLVVVGDARKLAEAVRYGIHYSTGSAAVSKAAQQLSSGSDGTLDSAPLVFFQKPFAVGGNKGTCGVLICDVAAGNSYTAPAAVHTPRDPTPDFLATYDSCSFVDPAKGAAVAVYSRQQVLPRFLLHCVIDPHLQPCPAHPDKAMEYYVVDTHAFVCSRCVVLGAYKGREVIPLDEAAVLARGGLAEIEQTTSALKESLLAYANQLRNEEGSMSGAPRRTEAEREIDRLQKELEERVRRIRRQVQLEDEAQLSRIQADRKEVESTLEAVGRLASRLESAMHLSTPMETVDALQHMQQENEVEQLLARAQERVPTAALERVLPLDGPRSSSREVPSAAPGVAGLNESRLPTQTEGRRELPVSTAPPPLDRSSAAQRVPIQRNEAAGNVDLYSQYLALAGGTPSSPATATPSLLNAPSRGNSEAVATRRLHAASPALVEGSEAQKPAESPLSPKEALTTGWGLLRRGDVAGAQRVWTSVCREHGTNDVMGTKAHAYLAEAIHKNYTEAAQWYARSLQLDPQDRMTAYNYGVLLEALLNKPHEALRMYDRAAALGDGVAAARARELRAAMAGLNDAPHH